MISPTQMAMLRAALPSGYQIPGIDTSAGNPLPAASLVDARTITTNPSATFFFDSASNRVVVNGAGVTIQGYNFASVFLYVNGANCTVDSCTFDDNTAPLPSIIGQRTATGLTVQNCTFNGGDNVNSTGWVNANAIGMTVTGCAFLKTPSHAISTIGGTISGNFFQGAGYLTGAHPDAINCLYSAAPLTVTNNFIDWTMSPDMPPNGSTNNCIRFTTENGNNRAGLTVTGNILLGGLWTVTACATAVTWPFTGQPPLKGDMGAMSNVTLTGNYMGWAIWGPISATNGKTTLPATNSTFAPNTMVDWTNPIYSTAAWSGLQASYEAPALTAAQAALATAQAAYADAIAAAEAALSAAQAAFTGAQANVAASWTAYSAKIQYSGVQGATLHATAAKPILIGGAGPQYLQGGVSGVQTIFKYLSPGDSPSGGGRDCVQTFNAASDAFDFSAMPGLTLASGAPGSGQVGWTTSATETQLMLMLPDSSVTPDMIIRIIGHPALTPANFIF